MQFFHLIQKNMVFYFLFGAYFLIVHYSPQLLDRVQPDSSSYLNPSPFVDKFYIIYSLCFVTKINIDIIFFSRILYEFMLYAYFTLKKKKN